MVVIRLALAAALAVPSVASADRACLPRSVFANPDSYVPGLDLGLVDGAPVLCAPAEGESGGMVGCWSVNPKTGALSASTATALPGHSQRRKSDAKGCVDGYCPSGTPSADTVSLFTVSTDGKHAVLLDQASLFVFDTATKKVTKTIPLYEEKAPGNTNVGNAPIDITYIGNRIFVAGSDAGPYIAVWVYLDNGTRVGSVGSSDPDSGGRNVYEGAANALDGTRMLVAGAGWQHVTIIDAATGKTTEVTRAVKTKPCKPEELELLEESGGASKACRKVIDKVLGPYIGLDPVALPDGTLLAAMAGTYRGTLMLLDGTKLTEKKRFKLKRCSK